MEFRWAAFEAGLDPAIGSGQRGTRPVLVVSREAFNQSSTILTVLPMTSTERKLYPNEVLIEAGRAGQPKRSIIMAHQIRTISKQRLGRHYGYLNEPESQQLVLKAVANHVGASI
jgi:mRNA interferase MazF